MKRAIFFALLLGIAPIFADAATVGYPSPKDPRIQIATYSPDEVYKVYIQKGSATLIQLEADESPEKGLAGFGDSEAWTVGIRDSNIVIKPKADNPDTNVVIVTNKRSYVFSLITTPENVKPTFLLRFRYPDTEAKLKAAELEKKRLAEEKRKNDNAPPEKKNEAYSMAGDFKIAPTAAWDNGLFTTLQYADSREMPAVFKKTADGTEAIVNSHVEGDRLVIHETNNIFILRLGELVLGVYNDAYDPYGQFNARGTTVKDAIRVEKKNVQ